MKNHNRFQKARMLVDLSGIKVNKRDDKERITEAFVNGSAGKRYLVLLKRNREKDTILTECLLDTSNGNLPCPSSKFTICYHALSVLLQSASENGKKVLFTDTMEKAKKLLNFGGEIYTVYSEKEIERKAPVFMVVNDR